MKNTVKSGLSGHWVAGDPATHCFHTIHLAIFCVKMASLCVMFSVTISRKLYRSRRSNFSCETPKMQQLPRLVVKRPRWYKASAEPMSVIENQKSKVEKPTTKTFRKGVSHADVFAFLVAGLYDHWAFTMRARGQPCGQMA